MNFYIKSISLMGVKNIKNEIFLDFYNKSVEKTIDLRNNNIKAIYGANGSGKSAIIHAMNIYSNITKTKGYLYSVENQNYLNEIINKEKKSFSIKIEFIVYNNDLSVEHIYKHELTLKNNNNQYYISKENLFDVTTRTSKLLFSSSNGEVLKTTLNKKINEISKAQLKDRSIVEIVCNFIRDNLENENFEKIDSFIISFVLLSLSLNISTEESDKHGFYLYMKSKSNEKSSSLRREEPNVFVSSEYSYRVNTNELEELLKSFTYLEQFLRIFKKDLIEIKTVHKTDRDQTIVEPYLLYDGYQVHLEFESAGIKKLVELYNLFVKKEQGRIVFIDELDANINDIYLTKLLEYFNENHLGQLVFTTHNISPMDVLSNNKHAIDFLSDKQEIISWTKNGNSSAIKNYQNGLIKGLPFNIYPFDFVGIFGEELNDNDD